MPADPDAPFSGERGRTAPANLVRLIEDAIADEFSGTGAYPMDRLVPAAAKAVLDAIGLEHIGWWIGPWATEPERLSFHDPGFQHERVPVYRLGGQP